MEAEVTKSVKELGLSVTLSLGKNLADDDGRNYRTVLKESNRCYSGSGFSEMSMPKYHRSLPKESEENTVWGLSANLDFFDHSPDLSLSVSLPGCSNKRRKSLNSDSVFAAAEILTMMKNLPRFPAAEIGEQKPLGILLAPEMKLFNSFQPKKLRTNLKRKSRPSDDSQKIGLITLCQAADVKREIDNCPWSIKKRLTTSDVNHLSRLLIGKEVAKAKILAHLTENEECTVHTRDGLRVVIWDCDTNTSHPLVFKNIVSTRSYVFIDNWIKQNSIDATLVLVFVLVFLKRRCRNIITLSRKKPKKIRFGAYQPTSISLTIPLICPSLFNLPGCSSKRRKFLHSDSVFAAAEILTGMKNLPRFPPAEITEEKSLGILSAPDIELFNSSHPKKIKTYLKRKSKPSDYVRLLLGSLVRI
ncbi:hypothetical protein Nepgr_032752 [Nepenthes gracilis]|uniref:Uncharacterized protein n=1 Tax=Nepenthes gracilis TaxID=150966 RepID=A0AAD3TKK6_NEPGR|nr:hypothetical protein Nepgr_032752 [Nepenthes gracilis]